MAEGESQIRTVSRERTTLGTFSQSTYSLFRNMRLPSYVKSISDVGIDFSVMGKKNRLGVSRKESDKDDDDFYSAFMPSDVDVNTDAPYFNKKYAEKVKYLNVFATHPEIEYILHTLADEAIVYDKFGYFCKISTGDLNLKDNLKKAVEKNFKKIYTLLNFSDGLTAWAYFLQWLIEGYLAFEILYDNINDPTKIIGIEELDPATIFQMEMEEEYIDKKDRKRKRKVTVWKQVTVTKKGIPTERVIPDNSIIFIEYNKIPGNKDRISYAERLMRSFNLMRTMENTKVAWHVMNSQFRLKMIIPVGSKTTAKAKQALQQVTNKHREDLMIDHSSGEVTSSGQAKINFGRNIILPSRQGQTPEVDGVSYNGPDLSNMESVKYFERKLWRDSRLPWSRFDRENGAGQRILFQAEGVPHDELSFYRFINRLRREFETIIRKPVYLQTIMDFPELKIDLEFKSKLGVDYDSNSLFEEAKEQEIMNNKLENISKYEDLTEIDGRTPIFSKKFLYINKFEVMDEKEWDENRKLRDDEIREQKKRDREMAAEDKAASEVMNIINNPNPNDPNNPNPALPPAGEGQIQDNDSPLAL